AESANALLIALSAPLAAQGKLETLRSLLMRYSRWEVSVDLQERSIFLAVQAVILLVEGREHEALASAEAALAATAGFGASDQSTKIAFPAAAEAALATGARARAHALLEHIEALRPGGLAPFH